MIPDPRANFQNGHARDGNVQACKVLLSPRVMAEVSVGTELQDRVKPGNDAIACSGDDPSGECAQQWILLLTCVRRAGVLPGEHGVHL
jgi:hypothetical protein